MTGRSFVETARPVGAITVGHRHRTDLGDLESLQRSIQEVGLLQPITITPDGVLLCGLRRLEAGKRLGWRTVRCWVRSGLSHDLGRLLAEREENTQRKPLAPLEAAALYQELKTVLAEDAARRKHATTFGAGHEPGAETRVDGHGANRGTLGRGDSPPPHDLHGRTRAQAARLVTGNAGYKRLEQLSTLQRWTTDPRHPPAIRQMAAAELTQIQAGAPVQPAFDRVRHAIATTRAAETTTPRGRGRRRAAARTPRRPGRRTHQGPAAHRPQGQAAITTEASNPAMVRPDLDRARRMDQHRRPRRARHHAHRHRMEPLPAGPGRDRALRRAARGRTQTGADGGVGLPR